MATMYSLFFGILFTAFCGVNGDGSGVLRALLAAKSPIEGDIYSFLCRSVAAARPVPFLLTEKEPKGQGLVARLNCLLISGNKTNSLCSNKSDCFSEIIDNSLRLAQPRPFYQDTTSTPLQSGLMSPVKPSLRAHRRYILTSAPGGTAVPSECSSDKGYGYNNLMLNGIHELTGFGWTLGRYQVSRPSGMEDKRNLIIQIASKELGTREATGNNDGYRVEEYLRYTNLGKGYDWCASFVSWVYGQAGFPEPRNPWSPALFPKTRRITAGQAQTADLFGIYGVKAKRINHIGLIKERQATYLLTIEGNSNNRVESRRRHLKTIYALADWVE